MPASPTVPRLGTNLSSRRSPRRTMRTSRRWITTVTSPFASREHAPLGARQSCSDDKRPQPGSTDGGHPGSSRGHQPPRAHRDGEYLRLHLARLDLRGAHLRRAHLEGVRLRYSHLAGARLVGAHLESAKLREAHLGHADLAGAWLLETEMPGTHLDHATFDDDGEYGPALHDARTVWQTASTMQRRALAQVETASSQHRL